MFIPQVEEVRDCLIEAAAAVARGRQAVRSLGASDLADRLNALLLEIEKVRTEAYQGQFDGR